MVAHLLLGGVFIGALVYIANNFGTKVLSSDTEWNYARVGGFDPTKVTSKGTAGKPKTNGDWTALLDSQASKAKAREDGWWSKWETAGDSQGGWKSSDYRRHQIRTTSF